jgi:hypothetical protein
MDYKFIKVGTNSGVQINEYNGSINLQAGYEQKDGKIALEWVRYQHYDKIEKKKVPDAKDLPLRVYLGSKERSIEVLKELLGQLGYEIHQGEMDGRYPDDSEIPF